MQARGRGSAPPAVGVAFEGDLGHRIDALLVPALLNGLQAKGEARSIALCVSAPSLETAQLAEVVSRFYGGARGAAPAMIGMPEGAAPSDAPPLAAVLGHTAADGTQPYESRITNVLDTADNAVHIRNVLLAQHDNNAVIVLAGPATGIARLLALYGARPQIAAKVRHLVVALGVYPSGPAHPDVAKDVTAARKMFAEWPTPIIAVGAEVGTALPFPGASFQQEFEWAPNHPIADAYRKFKPMPYDAPASALAATLQAVQPDAKYFALSEPGTISVLDDGRTQFTPGAGGPHRYLVVDPAQKNRVSGLYAELVTHEPASRGGRRGGPPPAQQDEKKPEPPPAKPAAAPPAAPPADAPKPPVPEQPVR
jgi:hypothetical protein